MPPVRVPIFPAIDSLPVLLSPPEISLVGLAISKFENSLSMFEVVKPAPFVCIPVLVPVETLAALVVPELPPKNIPVEKC